MNTQSVPWARISAEFLVIFAGVTLSLAADDWRQDRQDRAQEGALLLGVHEDLVADSVELATALRWSRRWDEASAFLQRRIKSGPPLPVDTATTQLAGVIIFGRYQAVNAAYSALEQAGQMSLIQDPELRQSITRYYEVRQPAQVQIYNEAFDAWREWSAVFFRYVEVPLPTDSSRHSPQALQFIGPWSDFARDPTVRPALTKMGVMGGNRATNVESALRANRNLRTLLASHIEPH